MDLPTDFYTPATFFTLGGMAMGVWVVTSSIGHVVPRTGEQAKRWIGLALSLFFVLVYASLLQDRTLVTWVIATVNGFLVYLTAVGINTVSAPSTSREVLTSPVKETAAIVEKKRSRFFERWW